MSLEITEYDPLKAEIAKLKASNAAIVFQYDTKEGNKNARSHIYVMKQKRAEVERTRKELKAGALEYGRKVDAVAATLEFELSGMIAVHQKPLDEIEAKVAAEQAEAARKVEEARLLAERVEREKQEAILAAERAEAARVKAELDAVQRKAREDEIARQAADKARRDAEADAAREREQMVERERKSNEAKIQAERDKLAAERREFEAQQKALRDKAEAAEQAEREKLEAAQRAKLEQEAAVRKAVEEQSRRQQQERDAAERKRIADAEAEAARLKQIKVREAIIKELASDILHISKTTFEASKLVAIAILDGKITGVKYVSGFPTRPVPMEKV